MARRRRVREGVGLVLLFLFAVAVAGFVLFVYLQPEDHVVQPGDTPTLPPGVVPCCPVVTSTTVAP